MRGEMSFVGPRPLILKYLDRYTPEQRRRHEVRPGITGWAQVNGRNALTWEERFQLDVWYVEHWTFALDVKIILKTVYKVFLGKDTSQNGRATMEEFLGSNQL
jgi:lipopolysaccharide/colanic/teichoic acid biosynthesis glycosyltransferase